MSDADNYEMMPVFDVEFEFNKSNKEILVSCIATSLKSDGIILDQYETGYAGDKYRFKNEEYYVHMIIWGKMHGAITLSFYQEKAKKADKSGQQRKATIDFASMDAYLDRCRKLQ